MRKLKRFIMLFGLVALAVGVMAGSALAGPKTESITGTFSGVLNSGTFIVPIPPTFVFGPVPGFSITTYAASSTTQGGVLGAATATSGGFSIMNPNINHFPPYVITSGTARTTCLDVADGWATGLALVISGDGSFAANGDLVAFEYRDGGSSDQARYANISNGVFGADYTPPISLSNCNVDTIKALMNNFPDDSNPGDTSGKIASGTGGGVTVSKG